MTLTKECFEHAKSLARFLDASRSCELDDEIFHRVRSPLRDLTCVLARALVEANGELRVSARRLDPSFRKVAQEALFGRHLLPHDLSRLYFSKIDQKTDERISRHCAHFRIVRELG